MMTPQWFILMAKLLIYQIRFQSASSCAKTGPRKENPFCLGQKILHLRPDFILESQKKKYKKGMTRYGSNTSKGNTVKKQ